jgi:glutaminyl-tRNA synthetase
VRLRGAGIIRRDEVIKDADGTITELRGWLDPESRPGMEGANRKVKGTIHWVSACMACRPRSACTTACSRCRTRMMNRKARPTAITSIRIAPHRHRLCRAGRASAAPEQSFQFERTGYFVADRRDHTEAKPVFNRSVTLRDTWSADLRGRQHGARHRQ